METIVKNNQVLQEGLFINYHKPSQKEIDFTDCVCFILCTAIHNLEDMGFLTKEQLYNSDFEQCQYGTDEEVWEVLFNTTNAVDYEDFEERFESCSWEDNNNTCIAKIDGVEYAILRM